MPSQDAKFGDYQINCAMPLGKTLKRPPREVAQQVVAGLKFDDVATAPEIAGPGFINLRLQAGWMAAQLQSMARSERLGVEPATPPHAFACTQNAAAAGSR